MAKQVITELFDDIDDTAIAEGQGTTIEFSVDGVDYVIDLKTKNANEFHKKLDYYIEHATRVGGRKRKAVSAAATKAAPAAASSTRAPSQTREIRQWAADSGYDINDRGRIPADIVEAYEAAH